MKGAGEEGKRKENIAGRGLTWKRRGLGMVLGMIWGNWGNRLSLELWSHIDNCVCVRECIHAHVYMYDPLNMHSKHTNMSTRKNVHINGLFLYLITRN